MFWRGLLGRGSPPVPEGSLCPRPGSFVFRDHFGRELARVPTWYPEVWIEGTRRYVSAFPLRNGTGHPLEIGRVDLERSDGPTVRLKHDDKLSPGMSLEFTMFVPPGARS